MAGQALLRHALRPTEVRRAEGKLHFGDALVRAQAACSISGCMYAWYRPDGHLSAEQMLRELAPLARRAVGLARNNFPPIQELP